MTFIKDSNEYMKIFARALRICSSRDSDDMIEYEALVNALVEYEQYIDSLKKMKISYDQNI